MRYLIIIFSLIVMGCSNLKLNSEHSVTYYENGKIKSDITVIGGVKNGIVLNYFEDGNLAVKGYFSENKRDKKWYFYDENTKKLAAIENYKNGELEGEQFYYYPNGSLKLKGSYKDNIRIGFWQMYDEEGNLTIQNIFLDGEKVISVALFHENGNILCSGLTKDGLRDGVWQYFDEDGVLLYDVEYSAGIRDGEWKAYDRDGNIIITGYYNNGKILGLE